MAENPLRKLESFGQSIWMDYIRRNSLDSGELKHWIDEDGASGVTSNPSIFDKAISGSHDYDDEITSLAKQGKDAKQIFQVMAVEDIQRAADLFRPTYDRVGGKDGFVSIEVSPTLAHDTQGTIEEARHLWKAVDRPNVMIKVPATKEGLPAIRQLISEGININITLLFGLPRYREVVDAYLTGLEARVKSGEPIDKIHSVASFFLSRIDVLLDPRLERIEKEDWPNADRAVAAHGQVAISSAKVAYQIFKKEFTSDRFKKLAQHGATRQRLLWASTSTKNPAYQDVKYVEALIGPETVNTVPVETLNAYRDHGDPAERLTEGVDEARKVLQSLIRLDIDLDQATQQLEDEGVDKFNTSFDQLLKSISDKIEKSLLENGIDRQILKLNGYQEAARDWLDTLAEQHFMEGFWRKDAALWKEDPQSQKTIRDSMGWLHVAEKMEENIRELDDFANDVIEAGFRQVVHMGMGGSSLAPLVLAQTFPPQSRGIPVAVLDTTDPNTIRSLTKRLPIAETLFIVASKSGTTAEAIAFENYFFEQVKALKGDSAGENFVVITDPGTPMEKSAKERGYRKIFLNFADIGGRYSALSFFGMVPAVLLGIDIRELLTRALKMQHACDACVPPRENPGLVLGAVLGALATKGRNKVTFVLPIETGTFGMWLEQLIAESTGKDGTGLIPVSGEILGDGAVYGNDRVFVYIALHDETKQNIEDRLRDLEKIGHPVIRIDMDDRMDLGQEFFRWEVATAVAGSILGIDPFDQPNVKESKDNTNRLLQEVREKGRLPEQKADLDEENLRLYSKESAATIQETLHLLLKRGVPGDYIAILAYLTEDGQANNALQSIRHQLRDRTTLATTLGYGPRYLHSTGQLHKGGPNTGIYILFTNEEGDPVSIPGSSYSFGTLQHAQALGDYQALQKHGRRVVHIDLGKAPMEGLEAIRHMLLP